MSGKRRGRVVSLPLRAAMTCAAISLPAMAEPDPCSDRATLSPCFDADPVWPEAGPSPFSTLAGARGVERGVVHLLAAAGVSHRPVLLVAASPHPEGREIPVLQLTSTLTLAARYGLGRGMDVSLALPLVPYQAGTGAEGATSQRASAVRALTLRDPRVGFATTLYGAESDAPLALSSRLALGVPLGHAGALAGASGPVVLPSFAAELRQSRLTLALELGLRLRRAVSFGTVRAGSEGVLAAALAFTLLEQPVLAVMLEAFARPGLASPPVGAPPTARNLPAEWLLGARFAPEPGAPWSLSLGAGSGLPLSKTGAPGGASLGVTSPAFRALAAARYELGP